MTPGRLAAGAAATIAVCFLVLFIGSGSRFAIGLVLKPMADGFGWERSVLGSAVALFLCVSAFCLYVSGYLADRFPLRAILAGGFLVAAIGIGAMGMVDEPWQVLLLYGVVFAVGNGIASLTPIGVMVTRRFTGRIGLANGIAVSGMGLGQLVIITGLAAVLVALGWRSVFFWLGAVNLAMTIVAVAAIRADGLPATSGKNEAPAGLSLGEALRTRRYRLILAVYAICGLQDFFVSTHVVAFALDQGVGDLFAGNLLAFMGLAGLVGVLAAGAWSDRSGPAAPTVAGFALRIVLFGLILVTKDTAAVAVFALLFGLTFWVTAPLTVVFVRDACGLRNLGALSGFVTMVHHIFGGLGAWAGARVFDSTGGYDPAFMAMLGCAVLAVPLALGLRSTRPS